MALIAPTDTSFTRLRGDAVLSTAHQLGSIGSRESCAEQRSGVVRVTVELRDPDTAVNRARLTDYVERFG